MRERSEKGSTNAERSTTEDVLRYQYTDDPKFADTLRDVPWKLNADYGGITLQAPCPICEHSNGIEVFVPTDIATFRGTTDVKNEYVECVCDQDHKQPAGRVGCGRWGLVAPKMPQND